MLINKLCTVIWLSLSAGLAWCQPRTNSTDDHCSSSFLSSAIELPGNAQLLHLSAASAHTISNNATVNFCNVTVTYTHASGNDTIRIFVNFPRDNWNGRFQGVGGSGWATCSGLSALLSPVANGYSAGCTDGGHGLYFASSASWAGLPNGKLNLHLFEDFASVALNDLAVVGKQLARRYYGYGPRYSYWSGCSTGGRQGLMMAQKYPTAYNGIYAGAPAINWPAFIVAEYWSQFWMNQLNHHPPQCVFDTITNAALAACSSIHDGLIHEPGQCTFDPDTMIGQEANCSGNMVTISEKDTRIVKKTWEGPRTADGQWLWWGITPGTPFSGLTNTTCTGLDLRNCTGAPFSISADWITRWVMQDPDFDLHTLTLDTYVELFTKAFSEYNGIIGTNNVDLRAFQEAGGKMVTWHGLVDQLIFPDGSINYYRQVKAFDPTVENYYRFFPAPGVEHCGGGIGAVPSDPLAVVVDWVERGVAPDVLPAITSDGTRRRNLCMYPQVAFYVGGDPFAAGSYACKSAGEYVDDISPGTNFITDSKKDEL
ncbi:uncharacterized protein N7459_010017 [Penicillium hispanicum]|uniref:uncharacterized protein n=1 Tax=Penicillium hispanicum TaxID=1080232 RepID=UPI00253FCF73|nr:uncharacterized protein N7459_010017 [Penicillium hispanicum]KAJ5570587.1 hypothetical protein N7459_010017 [Penicillium hispanicum]